MLLVNLGIVMLNCGYNVAILGIKNLPKCGRMQVNSIDNNYPPVSYRTAEKCTTEMESKE